jgi:hypothetical protein
MYTYPYVGAFVSHATYNILIHNIWTLTFVFDVRKIYCEVYKRIFFTVVNALTVIILGYKYDKNVLPPSLT